MIGKRKRKKERPIYCPIFLLPSMSLFFSISGWLMQASNTDKKRYDRVLYSFMFLRIPLPFFVCWK